MAPHWPLLAVVAILLGPVSRHTVNSAGHLQIRLKSSTNLGLTPASEGRCCQTSNSIDDATCHGPCRAILRFCASADGAGIASRSAVRLSRISVLRSRRGRRSPAAVSQQYTDTPVPSGLPPIGDEDELLPVQHRSAPEETSGGTSIQVVHHLISSADDEDQDLTESSPGYEDSDLRPRPREESVGAVEDLQIPESAAATNSSGDAATSGPPLEGSALVGRPESQQPPDDQQDIGLVFVEDKDYIHLYFQPKRTRTRRSLGTDGTGAAAAAGVEGGAGAGAGTEGVPEAGAGAAVEQAVDSLTNTNASDGTAETEVEEGSGSEEPEETASVETEPEVEPAPVKTEPEEVASMWIEPSEEPKPTWRWPGAVAAPRRSAECPLGAAFVAVTMDDDEPTQQISLPFDTPWPGILNLAIEVWSDVTNDLNPAMADLSQLSLASLAGRATLRTSLTAAGDSWSNDVITAGDARLEVETRVVCGPGSEGSHCATACDRLAGGRGHWRCLEDGSAVCSDGWTGADCDQPVCMSGCSAHTGYCRVPGECLCKVGYHGELCSQCVTLPGCRNGYCKRSFECRCREGWTGLFCDKPICAKDCDKDRGFCTKPGECRCRPGWRGARCDQCVRLPGCRQGTCRQPLECNCRPGWTGFLCERAICRENCSKQHGYCEQPGVCRCELGWRGPLCDTCLPYPGCVNGNCTQPWQCNCHPGWTGFLCDKPTQPCPADVDHRCRNGGTCEMILEQGLPAPRCLCQVGFSGQTCEEADLPPRDLSAAYRTIARGAIGGGGGRWRWGRPHVPHRPAPVPHRPGPVLRRGPPLPVWSRFRRPAVRH